MTWFKLTDDFHANLKVMRAGNSAIGLWVRCCTWSAAHEKDGWVAMELAHTYGARDDIERLTATGLWIIDGDGYVIPDFLEYNPSHDELEAKRAAEAKRQQRWRDKHVSNAVTNEGVTP